MVSRGYTTSIKANQDLERWKSVLFLEIYGKPSQNLKRRCWYKRTSIFTRLFSKSLLPREKLRTGLPLIASLTREQSRLVQKRQESDFSRSFDPRVCSPNVYIDDVTLQSLVWLSLIGCCWHHCKNQSRTAWKSTSSVWNLRHRRLGTWSKTPVKTRM